MSVQVLWSELALRRMRELGDYVAAKDPAVLRYPGAPEQVVETTPILEPNAALGLLKKDALDPEEIAQVRGVVAGLPEASRPYFYRELAAKVSYRNQRNNAGDGDYQCSWTSIAMALNQLGVGVDETAGQMENQLDDEHLGDRYSKESRGAFVEAKFGLGQEYALLQFSDAADLRRWFEENVSPRLERGEAATMGNGDHARYSVNHIVRIEWVEADGVRVDDPYGQAAWTGSQYAYANSLNETEGEDGRGRDNLWSWEMLATIATTGASYVHFYGEK